VGRRRVYPNRAAQQAAYRQRQRIPVPAVVRWLEDLIAQGAQFGTVYADPPWPYAYTHMQGSAAAHYATMPLAELAALPVEQLVGPKAHCHLWTTTPFLPAALDLLQAWGFTYKSELVWCKPWGRGHFWRISHEICLLGVKGDNVTFRQKNLKSWFVCGRGEHSSKPDQVRHWIESASPGPYLELFGRRPVPGWTVFGDQVVPDLFGS
jgi:N6-adenosine-specific RNA methylase IME4